MKHFSPLWSLIPGAALIAGCGSQPKDKTSEHSPQKPNVVYLIADDLGIGDLSCYGATKVSTPNIDRLAGQGMQFTNAYATSSTSTPSRFEYADGHVSLATEEYRHRSGQFRTHHRYRLRHYGRYVQGRRLCNRCSR